jgi:hypothetical protein
MPRNYRNASRVLVWLGSGIDGEGETVRSLVRLGRQLDRLSFDSRQDQKTIQRVETQLSEAQEPIRKFFQLPWFGRRWVVQEAVLNPDVVFYCGLTEISLPRLYLAFEALPDYIWNDNSGSRVHKSLQNSVISGEHILIFPEKQLVPSSSIFWIHFITLNAKKLKTESMNLLAWQVMFEHQQG